MIGNESGTIRVRKCGLRGCNEPSIIGTPWTIGTPSSCGSNPPLITSNHLSLGSDISTTRQFHARNRLVDVASDGTASRCTASSDANASRSVYVPTNTRTCDACYSLLRNSSPFEDRFHGSELDRVERNLATVIWFLVFLLFARRTCFVWDFLYL